MNCKNPIRMKVNDIYYNFNCGRCIFCRLKKRQEWTLRIQNEAEEHVNNAFCTFTYDEQHVPQEVVVRDFQIFMKKLRIYLKRKGDTRKVKYFMSAEYGDTFGRPHHHAILFGLGPKDYDVIKKSWVNGFIEVSPLTPDRANYTCGYVQKKLDYNNDFTTSIYRMIKEDFDTRKEIINNIVIDSEFIDFYASMYELTSSQIHKLETAKRILPEREPFATASRGLGYSWFYKNIDSIKKQLFISWRGKRYGIPRAYKDLLFLDEEFKENYINHFVDFYKQKNKDYVNENFKFLDKDEQNYIYDSWYNISNNLNYLDDDEFIDYCYRTLNKKQLKQKEIELNKKNEIYWSKKRRKI